ncbi:MAG: tetratricopeptide repeat protein, partial [Candidatus Binatia bacterium]
MGLVAVLLGGLTACSVGGLYRSDGGSFYRSPFGRGATEVSGKDAAAGHFLVSLLAREQGDYERAMRELQHAVALDPEELYIRTGRLERSLAQAKVLKELEPGDDGHGLLVGELLISLGRYEEAVREYEELLEVAPDNIDVLVELGGLYTSTQRY